MRAVVYLAALAFFFGQSYGVETQAVANPIRKVVNLLQAMVKKVTEEGEKEEELFNKFQCYCKTGGGQLAATIEAAETKMPELTSAIEEATSQKNSVGRRSRCSKSRPRSRQKSNGRSNSDS